MADRYERTLMTENAASCCTFNKIEAAASNEVPECTLHAGGGRGGVEGGVK